VAGVASDVLGGFRAIVGEAHARPAGPDDAVDGLAPEVVVEPGSAEEVGETLRYARSRGLAVVPRGAGTKLGWGGPPRRADVVLGTRRLDRVVEHEAGDLVATAQAGVRLGAFQAQVSAAGQRLALDPPEDGTLGGTVSANASGPLRHRYGTARDLLIGIRVVLSDGTAAKAGGKVVKNVAGYDLGKLFTGAFGTLGVVVEATFRLHPRPRERRLVLLEVDAPAAAASAVQALLHSSLTPAAVELRWPEPAGGGSLAVLFEGTGRAVDAESRRAVGELQGEGATQVLEGPALEREWSERTALPFGGAAVGLKVGARPADLARVIEAVESASAEASLAPRIAGRAAVSALLLGLFGGEAEAHVRAVSRLRAELGSAAHVAVLHAPPGLKPLLDVWGPLERGSLDLMRRVKARLDPDGTLSPGRFVGGI